MNRELVRIPGPRGEVPATLTLPEAGAPKAIVILFNAGQMGRAGPQRLYFNAAAAWSAQGIASLRTDLAGIGDHPGENPDRHFDGHAVDEAAAVVAWAKGRFTHIPCVVLGLCAGARVAVRVAAMMPRQVHAAVLWGCPIISSAPGSLKSPFETQASMVAAREGKAVAEAADALRSGRILDPRWWLRRLRAGPGEIVALLRGLRRRGPAPASRNPFLDALDELLARDANLLFVYGQRDSLPLREFEQRYASRIPCAPAGEPLREARQQARLVPAATHTFNSIDGHSSVIAATADWIRTRVPG